jgi:hypothetical protein
MILVEHVQSHLIGIVDRGHVCLLRNPVGGGKMIPLSGENGGRTNAAKILQGCYLHYDREKGIWIRSGKATGQPFEDGLGQSYLYNVLDFNVVLYRIVFKLEVVYVIISGTILYLLQQYCSC